MNEEFVPNLLIFVLLIGLLGLLYKAVAKRTHNTRSTANSYLITLGIMLAIIVGWSTVLVVINSTFILPNNKIVASGIAAGIIVSLLRAWMWIVVRIQAPITKNTIASSFEINKRNQSVDSVLGNDFDYQYIPDPIDKYDYCKKYGLTEKNLDIAISKGKIRSCIYKGNLWVNDAELRK